MTVNDKFKKGLRLVFVDFFGLLVGILNGFFLPMVFSIDGYALFRTFTLFATYAVVFSFGLSDGLYLLYGGKDEREIDAGKTKSYYVFLIKLQGVVFIFLFLISYFVLKDTAFIFFSFFVVPLQLINFFRLYYRALGEFDKYSLSQAVLVFFELLNTLFIAFYLKSSQPDIFITIKILNHVLLALCLTILFFIRFKDVKKVNLKWNDYLEIMKPGFVILMADMAAALIFSLDRWFVMLSFDKDNFAYYSFAVSILNMFIIFITSITNIFYSYISRRVEDIIYRINLKNCIVLISSVFPLVYFLLEFIVKTFLGKYEESLSVLWILILSLPFIGIVNIVYINLYKASMSIKLYLKKMIVVLGVSFILNILAVIIFNSIPAIAWATLVSFVFWYIYSSGDFEGLGISGKEIAYLAVLITGFIFAKVVFNNLFVLSIVYLFVIIIDILIFYREEAIKLIVFIKKNMNIKKTKLR